MIYISVSSDDSDYNDLEKKYEEFKSNEINKDINIWKYIFSFSFVVSIILIILLNYNSKLYSQKIQSLFHSKDTSLPNFEIELYNPSYGLPETLKYVPWDQVVEPFKTNVAELVKLSINEDPLILTDFDITWNIDGNLYKGSTVSFQINKVDIQTVTITATNGNTIYNYEFTLAIKYIRREIRSLTDEDRNLFLDTFHQLYVTSNVEGKKKYGKKFISAEEFSFKHLNGAARVDCDHWHDGAGIVNHHVAYTLEIEQALQAIDPSISMPYWEYAMDSVLYDDWQESPIFNDDWFGDNNPDNELHALNTGRWGDVLVPSGESYREWSIAETSSLNPFVNGRGHLRSPWNNNPSRYIGRSNTTYSVSSDPFPNCAINYHCFISSSLSSMLNCLNGVTHGPVHIKIGGAWNEGDIFDDHTLDFVHNIDRVLLFKLLWRTGYTRCPITCEDEDCSCKVPDEYINSYGAKNILINSGIWDVYGDSKFSMFNDDQLLVILRALEDPDSVGDMFTSGASFDPTFWPLHGQIERILGLKRILSSKKLVPFKEDWEYLLDDGRVLNGVCDWKSITDATDLTLPTCDFSGETSCWGHAEDDKIEWTDFLGNDEEYTNKDFYELIHPWNENLPYIYDTYGFSYCNSAKFPFETS